jgi:hypothetical protein
MSDTSQSIFKVLFNDKLLLTLMILYILLITLALYFNSKSWMQYKGDTKTSVDEVLDDEEDKLRSTRTRWWNLFTKNKLFFYIIFVGVGFISLITIWMLKWYSVNFSDSQTGSSYFVTFMKVVMGYAIVIGLIALSFYFLSYTPAPLTIVINILNLLILSGVVAMFFEKTTKSNAAAGLASLFTIIFLLIGAQWWSIAGGIIGGFIGLFIGKPSSINPDAKPNLFREFLKSVIFYLPCLFIKFADYLKREFGLVKNDKSTQILIGIEIILISLRFLIPLIYKFFQKQLMPQGNILIKNPVSLHNPISLGIFESKQERKDGDLTEKTFMNYNYALSFWIWIIPQAPSISTAYSKPTDLVNINDLIKVIFNKNKIEFWASTTHPNELNEHMIKLYTLKKFEYQRWNNFIINYYGGTLDIFVNNKLVSSTPNITPLNNIQKAVAGQTDGVYGGIKNAVYYEKTLTKQEINIINSV